jgi:hypothetical protein
MKGYRKRRKLPISQGKRPERKNKTKTCLHHELGILAFITMRKNIFLLFNSPTLVLFT